MSIIYPKTIEECPSYLKCGGDEWRNEVRIANNFGSHNEYNIGDIVETISFYYADSESQKQNQVRIDKGILEKICKFDTHTSYHVVCNNCCKITPIEYIRPFNI